MQLLDVELLLEAFPDGTTCRLRAFIGGFVALGSPLCELYPAPGEDVREDVIREVRRTIHLGRTRTTQQDVAFVFRQLVDVALRALSPGINDPTTAQESLVHIGSLLRQLLEGGLGRPEVSDDQGRRVMRPYDPGTDDYVNLAFDQIRRAGTGQPSIAITVLEVIGTTIAELERAGTKDGVDALRRQARLTLEGTEAAEPLPGDLESVRATARRWDLI